MSENDHITQRQTVNISKGGAGKKDSFFTNGLAAEGSFDKAGDSVINNEERREAKSDLCSFLGAVTLVNFSEWTNVVLMVSLIFGGCCANVSSI